MRIDLASIKSSRWARGALLASLALLPVLAGAEEAAPPTPDKGDTSWMMTSTVLVILMTIPGLALFYGGMVRAKNMLSVLMQVFVTFSLLVLLWAIYGYSIAFTQGTTPSSAASTGCSCPAWTRRTTARRWPPSARAWCIPEFVYFCFQATFAAITPCLIVGALRGARQVLRDAGVHGAVVHLLLPADRAHGLVVGGSGRVHRRTDGGAAATATAGFIFQKGALDFAGGTVVHINAGIAGLVGCLMVGKRTGYGTTAMPPHNLPFMMIGAALLWVGWFGFNVGSNLEASGFAGLVFTNTLLATGAATLAWMFLEWILKGKPTMLGAASGAIAGLVAITPACGWIGPMASHRPWPAGRHRLPVRGHQAEERRWATTTRWTCSACTASAASWAPS